MAVADITVEVLRCNEVTVTGGASTTLRGPESPFLLVRSSTEAA